MSAELTAADIRLAEQYVSVLDFVSRCAQAIEGGNWHYLWAKAHQLEEATRGLRQLLSRPGSRQAPASPDPAPRSSAQRWRTGAATPWPAGCYIPNRAVARMSAVAAELAATVALRPAHRVACQGCGWIGYRRKPWCRDCPACGVDASKVRPEWLAGCAPRRGRCCYLGHIEDAGIPARVIDELMGHAGGRGGGGEQERRGSLIGLRYRWTTPEMEARVVAAITQRLAVAFTVAACTAAGDRAAKPTE